MKRYPLIPFILFILVLLATPALAQEGDGSAPAAEPAPATGVVSGYVVNGTADGAAPGEGEPMLHIWDADFQEQGMEHGELSAGGAFRFEDVPFVPGWQYAVMLNYQDVTYFSEPATVAEGQEELQLELPVYEATADTGAVRVSRQHLFFDAAAADRLLVGEIYVLSNGSDRTVALPADADAASAPLAFTLPPEAQDIGLENNSNGRFKATDAGFVDTAPLRPGEAVSQVVVRYTLPYEDPFTYSLSAPWPVDGLNVLLPAASGLAVEGTGLEWQETQQMDNGGDVDIFSHEALAAGETLSLALSGVLVAPPPATSANAPSASAPTTPQTAAPASSLLPPAALLLGLLLVTLAVWLYRRPAPEPAPVAATPASFDALVTEIALLNEAHEAGRIDDTDYTRRRSLLLSRAQQRMPES